MTWQGVAGRWAEFSFLQTLPTLVVYVHPGNSFWLSSGFNMMFAYEEHSVNIYRIVSYHLPCVYYQTKQNKTKTVTMSSSRVFSFLSVFLSHEGTGALVESIAKTLLRSETCVHENTCG